MDSIIDPMDRSLAKLWEIVRDREACYAAVHGQHSWYVFKESDTT